MPDVDRRAEVLLQIEAKFDDEYRKRIGLAGEMLVVAKSKAQLAEIGRDDLASQVRHVSLRSDALGYDVSAPRTLGSRRLFEVKSFTSDLGNGVARVYLSRNEAEVGTSNQADWYLVFCRVDDIDTPAGEIVGWCPRHQLDSMFPVDTATGRWQSVELHIRVSDLAPGLPRPT